MRRTALALASVAVFMAPTPMVRTAEAGPTWCQVYCDVITAGCMATFAQFEPEACVQFHEGCMDGCEAEG